MVRADDNWINSATLFVIDDDAEHLFFIKNKLAPLGYKIVTFSDPKLALENIRKDSEGLIVVDYLLPDTNGLEFIEKLHAKGVNLPFVVVTGFGDEELAVKALKMGATDYIVKNRDYISILPAKITEALEKYTFTKRINNAEIALRESEEKFRKLICSSKEGIALITPDGEILEWNDSLFDLTGVSREQALSMKLWEVPTLFLENSTKTPDKFEYLKKVTLQRLSNIVSQGKPSIYERKVSNVDGSSRIVSMISYPVFTDNQIYICSMMRDVTNEALLRRKLNYRIQFESLLNEISTRLINLRIEEVEEEIDFALEIISVFCNASGSALFDFNGQSLSCTNRWLPDFSAEAFSVNQKKLAFDKWLHERLLSGDLQIINYNRFYSKVCPAEELNNFMDEFDLKNLLFIPVLIHEKPVGVFLLFNRELETIWSDEDLTLIKTFSEIVFNSKDRTRYEFMIQSDLKLHTAIAEISSAFIAQKSINDVVNLLLEKLLDICDADFGFLYLKNENNEYKIDSITLKIYNSLYQHFYSGFNPEELIGICSKELDSSFSFSLDNNVLNYDNFTKFPIDINDEHFGCLFIGKKDNEISSYGLDSIEKILSTFSISLNRWQILEKLRKSEENYRLVTETAKDFIIVLNNDNKVIFANKSVLDATGYEKTEVIGAGAENFLLQKYKEWTPERIKNRLNIDGTIIRFLEIFAKNGEVIPLETLVTPFSHSGSNDAVLIIGRDLRERFKAESALSESEQKYRILIEQAFDGIYLIHNNHYEYVNSKFCEMTGYSEKELLAQDFDFNVMLDDESKAFMQDRYNRRKNNLPIDNQYEIRVRRKDSRVIDVEVTTVPLKLGDELLVQGIMRDITERKMYERKIIERDEVLEIISYGAEQFLKNKNWRDKVQDFINKLRIATKSSNVMLYEYEVDDNQEYIAHLIYYSTDNSVQFHQNFDEFKEIRLNTDERFEFYKALKSHKILSDEYGFTNDLLRSHAGDIKSFTILPIFCGNTLWGNIGFNVTDRHRKLDKQELELLETVANLIGSAIYRDMIQDELNNINNQLEKRVYERTAQLSDTLIELREEVSNRKRAEKELLKAKDDIEQAYEKEKELSELKGKFISMISHEYRTPLTIIQSSTYILERALQVADIDLGNRHLDRVRIAVKQMVDLLENVLVNQRIESQEVESPLKPLNIVQLTYEVIEEVNIIDRNKHVIEFESRLSREQINSDENLLHLIINNLLSNATKYSPLDTIIKVTLCDDSENIKIKVEDKGSGISSKDQKYLFTPFYRGENCGNVVGVGLGLSLVKSSVEMLKGKIEYSTEVGKGSMFEVIIPSNL